MQRGERPDVIGKSQSFDGYACIIRNARVDGNEIVLALQLHAISGKIDVCDRVRAGRRRLIKKIPKCASQGFLVKIACAGNVEPGCLQRLRHQTGVIGGRWQGAGLIVGVPHNEGNAALGGLSRERQGQDGQQGVKYRLHSGRLPRPFSPRRAP